jgi:hypothetical protein
MHKPELPVKIVKIVIEAFPPTILKLQFLCILVFTNFHRFAYLHSGEDANKSFFHRVTFEGIWIPWASTDILTGVEAPVPYSPHVL